MKMPDCMNYIQITEPGGPEVLKLAHAPVPEPGEREVLIKVHAAGVNRPDVIQRMGNYPMKPGMSSVPGLEVAGKVIRVGASVTGFKVGDNVCALTNGGGYAEYCAVVESQVLPIPDGLDMIHAAAIPETFFTVWANLFELGHARKGSTVLIHGGTSGIGTTALMLCKAFGIKAYATAGSQEKCEQIRALGGKAINYRDADFAQVIAQDTQNKGVDVILDIMGGSYFESNVNSLARRGRLVIIGFLGGSHIEHFNLLALAEKQATVTGSMMRSRSEEEKAEIARALTKHIWPLLDNGGCAPIIDRVFPLAEAPRAHQRMEQGEHIGKIVLEVL
ncbi:NAD(P)H-quinone oxidoreductase [Pseudomonas chlororaphis]|uniref:NAD(P)H-quinone oxidoreductase n=1 Tax=Pseudomonas chlororaphis TaxID=587753 RepID=UPI0003D32088|nr:NAD(P)H-quinone oxidoreductase [Pseudomonas chlororaphis]AZD29846.1 Quinone oxidoreductase [Pseudomonas chlororaphis]ETD39246.1 NAD(P)H quinone oxidoreductase [Pseudomonas chlororaphis subsp. aurantiaca PB-St2]QFS55292.1 zinc-binding dehydrogenase [Pseudomonas chlororaphis subsp. aurantiaca]